MVCVPQRLNSMVCTDRHTTWPNPPTGVGAVVSSQRSGSAVLMWVMHYELTFEILPLLPSSIWLLCITLVWAGRGLVMGVGTGMGNELWLAAGAGQPGSMKPCGDCSLVFRPPHSPDDSTPLTRADWRLNPAFDLPRRHPWNIYEFTLDSVSGRVMFILGRSSAH